MVGVNPCQKVCWLNKRATNEQDEQQSFKGMTNSRNHPRPAKFLMQLVGHLIGLPNPAALKPHKTINLAYSNGRDFRARRVFPRPPFIRRHSSMGYLQKPYERLLPDL